MRKVYYFLTLLLTVGFFQAQAQTYEQVTATSGTQVTPGGITVNVSTSFPAPPFTNTQCATGPYQIGRTFSDYYEYDFPNDITHVKLEMIKIHKDDTVEIEINNALYTLTGANITPYGATCTPAYTSASLVFPNGMLNTTNATATGEGATVTIQITPAVIGNLRVRHARHIANNIASDVTYNLWVADDSCSLGFVAQVDSPTCSGRDIQLQVTNFPNTTYAWTSNAPLTPPWFPSSNVYNPVLMNANQGHSGQYYVAATRGSCVYRDTINVLVSQSPALGPVRQTGPVCPNEDDTLFVPLVNLPIGGWVVATSVNGNDTFDATQGYIKELKDVQTSQANTSYLVYAIDIQGCSSDTTEFIFRMNPDVVSAFTFDLGESCDFDTVAFNNLSTTDSPTVYSLTHAWSYGDGNGSNSESPTHLYTVPKPNYTDYTYTVRLVVTNGLCYDTSTQPIYINHPVKAYFEYDDDSICQGGTINFVAEDSSFVKPGSTPKMLWQFGDGAQDTVFDVSHTYTKAGIYQAKFIMEDFLKCKDSFMREVVVDSSGYVNFTTDKENVCVGEEIVFTGEYSTFGYVTAIWNFADGVTIPDSTLVYHSYDKPGTYSVVFAIDYRICDDVSFTGEYTIKPTPEVYLGEDTAICPNGEQLYIADMYNQGNPDNIKYSWNTPTKDVTPGVIVRHHGTYAVTADLNGCTASDTLVVRKNCYINVPNAFTPNGDGMGDYFLPRQLLSRNITSFEMQVYNRWGEKVFETNATNGRGWDGKYGGTDQPTGVYIYVMQVGFGNGVTERYQGNVTLLR